MEAATDIDRLRTFRIVTDVCQHQIFRPGENLIPGGFTGLSLLLQRTAETFFGISLPYSVINIALNAIPAIIGFRMIGKKFTSYTVLMIVLNSFLVDLIPVTPITYDPLLVSVFGGILNGTAISIALFGKASSGGTDFIAVYLSSRLHKPSWNFVFGINVVILTTAGFLFGFEAAMYSIIFQFVSTQTINTLQKRSKSNHVHRHPSRSDAGAEDYGMYQAWNHTSCRSGLLSERGQRHAVHSTGRR